MPRLASRSVRPILYRVGCHLSPRTLQHLDNAVNYLACARFAVERGLRDAPSFLNREDLFAKIAEDVGDKATLYLEFGVYRGASMRAWSRLLTHPRARLHGFDSFQGLPEDWNHAAPRGHFTTEGRIPEIDDSRATFFPGLFEETLPTHELGEYERLVIALDADLYSSTRFVLNCLEKAIVPGTYLYFDEFCHRHHEMKAFLEFEARTGVQFACVGQSGCWERAAFQRVA